MIINILIFICFLIIIAYTIYDILNVHSKRTFWDHERNTIGRREDRVISSFWAGEAARSWEKHHRK